LKENDTEMGPEETTTGIAHVGKYLAEMAFGAVVEKG
jgi:hypothetical protein